MCVNFNQDYSCIAVGTRKGYKIYNCDPFGKCYQKQDSGMGLVEMLFCTSLVALSGSGDNPKLSPRKLQIINTKRQSIICELTFASTVLAVRLNRKRLVVILAEHIYIYDIGNMKLLHTIDVCISVAQTCALSPSSEHCYLAYPVSAAHRSQLDPTTSLVDGLDSPNSPYPSGSSPFPNGSSSVAATFSSFQSGKGASDLLLFDAATLVPIKSLTAHKSQLACTNFNLDGTLVATASDKGTVVRVFSVPSGEKLWQFRRGTLPARINCLSFNAKSTLLAVSSETDTVHIFRLDVKSKLNKDDGSRRSTLSSITGYILPDMVQQMYEPERDFAHAKIRLENKSGFFLKSASKYQSHAESGNGGEETDGSVTSTAARTVCAISNVTSQLLVVTSEGYLYQFSIDTVNGGECIPLNQYSFLDSDENATKS